MLKRQRIYAKRNSKGKAMAKTIPQRMVDKVADFVDDLKSEPKKNRGRPKGSKTRDAPQVKTTLSRCPGCDSTKLKTLRSQTRDYVGTLPDGTKYTSITWRRCQCEDCAKCAMVLEYHFDPKVWKAGGGKPASRSTR